ncbi:DUF2239 family protein [Variovorax sp. dw_308]|uniref:DUF2239 family protein n=1 Tax=Variovorax sp. dw_308 TaxID=2721546 RepID=UPI001C450714|nr:DUF2239 family protein [Variovorax sp. dw_308]
MPHVDTDSPPDSLTVFAGFHRIAAGPRAEVIAQLRSRTDSQPLFVFDDTTGEPIDLDLRDDALPHATAPEPPTRTVGRPKLGVVAREVTLLPRHWDWLNRQPGGASVALRKLVEDARKVNAERDTVRASRETAYRFMSAIAGHLPDFEEASRALFAGEQVRFEGLVAGWPQDVKAHLARLSANAWVVA